jgi:FG-GAP repeat protein
VAIAGDTLAVGADFEDVGPNLSQGSVYIFTRSGGTWTEQQEITFRLYV